MKCYSINCAYDLIILKFSLSLKSFKSLETQQSCAPGFDMLSFSGQFDPKIACIDVKSSVSLLSLNDWQPLYFFSWRLDIKMFVNITLIGFISCKLKCAIRISGAGWKESGGMMYLAFWEKLGCLVWFDRSILKYIFDKWTIFYPLTVGKGQRDYPTYKVWTNKTFNH